MRYSTTENSIQRRFLRFHRENPHVYYELVSLCRQAKACGQKHIGVKMLWEVMRWNRLIQTKSALGIKLDNNHHSRYARLVAKKEPDLAGMFRFRELKAL